ncbi:hypothetical protein ACJ41O_006402 [Fusarium nematophilum]
MLQPSCVNTGRKCDGYANDSLRLVRCPPKPPDVSQPESRALQFFYSETAPQLSGLFGHSFWSRSVLQFSLSEPAIRHALASVATLHERYLSPGLDIDGVPSLALLSYNRAIRCLINMTSREDTHIVVAAGIIFTCLEFMKGDINAATMHLANTTKLLTSWRHKMGAPDRPWGQRYPCFESSFIEMELAPIVCSLTNAMFQFRRPVKGIFLNPVDEAGYPNASISFKTVEEARIAFLDLTTAVANVSASAESLEPHDNVNDQVPEEILRLRFLLENWKTAFDDLVHRERSNLGVKDRRAADFVRLMWHNTHVASSACGAPSEAAWDSHRSDFEEMVRLADSLLQDQDPFSRERSKGFSLEMGLLSSLYVVAWKCRWPRIRRKALSLLLRARRRECLIDAELSHLVLSRIVEIEEGRGDVSPGAVPDDDYLPPEQMRVSHFSGTFRNDQQANLCLVYRLGSNIPGRERVTKMEELASSKLPACGPSGQNTPRAVLEPLYSKCTHHSKPAMAPCFTLF